MKTRKMKLWQKVMASGVLACMLTVNSMTAFACPDGHKAEENAAEAVEEQEPVVLYDSQFVDEEGNVTPVSTHMPRVWCFKHDIVSGYVQTHVKNDKGGCTVKTYEATQCIICNTIWTGDRIRVTTYVTCPH